MMPIRDLHDPGRLDQRCAVSEPERDAFRPHEGLREMVPGYMEPIRPAHHPMLRVVVVGRDLEHLVRKHHDDGPTPIRWGRALTGDEGQGEESHENAASCYDPRHGRRPHPVPVERGEEARFLG
jgi:hypothetical protein